MPKFHKINCPKRLIKCSICCLSPFFFSKTSRFLLEKVLISSRKSVIFFSKTWSFSSRMTSWNFHKILEFSWKFHNLNSCWFFQNKSCFLPLYILYNSSFWYIARIFWLYTQYYKTGSANSWEILKLRNYLYFESESWSLGLFKGKGSANWCFSRI